LLVSLGAWRERRPVALPGGQSFGAGHQRLGDIAARAIVVKAT
jgi:hypothetical protein